MNQTFDLGRFARYATRHYGLNGRQYGILTLSMFCVMLAVMLIPALAKYLVQGGDFEPVPPGAQNGVYTMMLFIYIMMWGIRIMKTFRDRFTMVIENTVPSSATEKYLFALLHTTVAVFASFLVSLILTALCGSYLFGAGEFGEYINNFFYKNTLYVMLAAQSAILYAGTMSYKNQALSFIMLGMAIVFLFVIVMVPIAARCDFSITLSNAEVSCYYPSAILPFMKSPEYTMWPLTALFWITGWFNFRERSIK